jgi:3-oxoacyl-(acyl-carrier-protein) synthase
VPEPVAVTAIAVMSALGNTPEEHQAAMDAGRSGLRPLRELPYPDAQFAELPAGWVEPREFLAGERYGPGTNFALELTRRLIADVSIEVEALRDAWLLVGTSRGNAAGWVETWPGRRGHGRMSTSNSMHSEMAAAVSIEFGIHGPYHVLSNGCSSGLDAIGLGYWAVRCGMAPRALVVSADLPLVSPLLSSYAETGLLSRNLLNDPYSPETTGFLPGEAGAALLLERVSEAARSAYGYLHGYWINSDAFHPLGLPPDGRGIADCLRAGLDELPGRRVAAVSVHASGTLAHGQAERRALQTVFADADREINLHLMKPFTGHAIGASGAVDTAVLLHYMRQGLFPPNLPGLTGAGAPFRLPDSPVPLAEEMVLKTSVGMGGHNAVVALSREAAG